MSPKADAYNVVTDRIIEALESGTVPWHKPWKTLAGVGPTSLQTGKPYRGINVWLLSLTAHAAGYSSPYWVTFKQAKERGGSVRKGEKGTQIVLWKPVRKTEQDEGGEDVERRYLILRYFTVFNVEQCDDVECPEVPELPADHDPIASCESIVSGWTGRPEVKHGGNRAYYSPALDYIQMPLSGQFTEPEGYYATLFHEMAHATGHESRLARKSLIHPAPFGSEDYSREELVAELAASYLCGEAGIPVNVEQSAAYIASWLKVLENDRKMLVSAAAQAQKASDLVLGIEYQNGEGSSSDDALRSVTQQKENHGRSRSHLRQWRSELRPLYGHPTRSRLCARDRRHGQRAQRLLHVACSGRVRRRPAPGRTHHARRDDRRGTPRGRGRASLGGHGGRGVKPRRSVTSTKEPSCLHPSPARLRATTTTATRL